MNDQMKLKRSSGILMHITSLPSPYGIGDLGATAYQFVDFLQESGHHYWQILPINPTEEALGHSPYSSFSAFAGNPLLISPQMLVEEGFLSKEDLNIVPSLEEQKVEFDAVSSFKADILQRAYSNFVKKEKQFIVPYSEFCEQNEQWLEDYALYLALKSKYQSSWTEWPEPIRDRDPETLRELRQALAQGIKREKIIQFLFFTQWQKLVNYCHEKEVYLIGDIPFYVTHDSVDCWAHSSYFKLDRHKKPLKVSGVPPDYFSETGQLWGTPVFDWEELKSNGFDWWMERLRQNLKLYDLVRLDHFRAFSAYWEVPAGEDTAIKGKWVASPGKEFFRLAKKKFPSMPFIAEDLGMMDDKVYKLLDAFGFPTMKVLQFAFDENMGGNTYSLHNHKKNCLVFTGTHDNNTTVGWFKSLKKDEAKLIADYVGGKVNIGNVHKVLHRLALMSVANLAIIPMQDILGLDEAAIMNRPGTGSGNWAWRMSAKQWPEDRVEELKLMNRIYGRWRDREAKESEKE